jgi:hypothetical protein
MAKGDHIFVRRFLYTHHGIDAGNGNAIHFTGENGEKKNPAVRETPMAAFANGGRVEVLRYGRARPSAEGVRVARSYLGRRGYNLGFNNCEPFARFCKTGTFTSEQVLRTCRIAGGSLGAILVVGVFLGTRVAAKSWRI